LLENDVEISAVYTQPPRPAGRGKKFKQVPLAEYAISENLRIHQPSDFKNEHQLNILNRYEPDYIVVVAYGLLLPKSVLGIPKNYCINVHASLLPRWRGASPINYTIFNHDKLSGVSIIKITEKLDAGPILSERSLQLNNKETYGELHATLSELGGELLVSTLENIGSISGSTQDSQRVTFAPKIKKEDTKINFYEKALEIEAKVRGLAPSPGAWFEYRNERIKIFEANALKGFGKPGEITHSSFTIGCGEGLLEIIKIQRPGKDILNINEFLKGCTVKKGDFVNLMS
jgi:methionyl-tRNA formyltransferase